MSERHSKIDKHYELQTTLATRHSVDDTACGQRVFYIGIKPRLSNSVHRPSSPACSNSAQNLKMDKFLVASFVVVIISSFLAISHGLSFGGDMFETDNTQMSACQLCYAVRDSDACDECLSEVDLETSQSDVEKRGGAFFRPRRTSCHCCFVSRFTNNYCCAICSGDLNTRGTKRTNTRPTVYHPLLRGGFNYQGKK